MSASVHEIKMKSIGFPGAPGWSTFYFDGDDATQHANQYRRVKAFVEMIKGLEPAQWHGQVQSSGRTLDTATGELIGMTTVPDDGTGNDVLGTAGGAAFGPGPAGLCFAWTTGGVNRSRRVRGRTFVVPVSGGIFQADGTIVEAVRVNLASDALTLFTDPVDLGIWSRPRAGGGGAWFPVVSCNVVDQAAVLRSRR